MHGLDESQVMTVTLSHHCLPDWSIACWRCAGPGAARSGGWDRYHSGWSAHPLECEHTHEGRHKTLTCKKASLNEERQKYQSLIIYKNTDNAGWVKLRPWITQVKNEAKSRSPPLKRNSCLYPIQIFFWGHILFETWGVGLGLLFIINDLSDLFKRTESNHRIISKHIH